MSRKLREAIVLLGVEVTSLPDLLTLPGSLWTGGCENFECEVREERVGY
jgi:hypothetical protein